MKTQGSDVVLAGLKEAGYDVVATISKDDDLRQSIKTMQPDLIIIDLESRTATIWKT